MKLWHIYDGAGHYLGDVQADTMLDALAAGGPEARVAVGQIPYRQKHSRAVRTYNHDPLDVREPREDDET